MSVAVNNNGNSTRRAAQNAESLYVPQSYQTDKILAMHNQLHEFAESAGSRREIGTTSIQLTPTGRTYDTTSRTSPTDLSSRRFMSWIRMMMEQDATIGAMLFVVEMLMRTVTWRVTTPKGQGNNSNANKYADHIESCMHDMNISWAEQLSEISSCVPYGWSYFEVVNKERLGFNQTDG
jgi:hypothetical protein